MNNKFSFIHCADLHLGATPLKLEERYDDFFNSFKSIINYAINNKISLVLISGDLFHIKTINSKTLLKTINILEEAKNNNIEVLVIEGNHDKAFFVDEESWLNFLNERKYIKLLSHKIKDGKVIDIEKYENELIQVFGVGYLGTSTEDHIEEIKEIIESKKTKNKFTVLMLHAAINKLIFLELASIKKDKINVLKSCVDYLALGHIHYNYSDEEWIYNPGSIERLRIDENNSKKGFYVINIENELFKVKFEELTTRKYVNKKIEIDNCKNEKEVEEKITNFDYESNLEQSVLSISLYGKLEWNSLLIDFEKIKEELSQKYNLLYVEINNYINIYSDEKEVEEINFEMIEKNEIEKEIKKLYPDKDIKEFVKQTIQLKNSILAGENSNEILDNLIDNEVFNED